MTREELAVEVMREVGFSEKEIEYRREHIRRVAPGFGLVEVPPEKVNERKLYFLLCLLKAETETPKGREKMFRKALAAIEKRRKEN